MQAMNYIHFIAVESGQRLTLSSHCFLTGRAYLRDIALGDLYGRLSGCRRESNFDICGILKTRYHDYL